MPLPHVIPEEALPRSSGPFIGRVVSHKDPRYLGSLQVELLRTDGPSSIKNIDNTLIECKYLSPFFGSTPHEYNGKNNIYDHTQKSYGFWAVPPDVGTLVMVMFIEGDPKKAYWIGCIPDEYMNFSVPGIPAAEVKTKTGTAKMPVAEYNKKANDTGIYDTNLLDRPVHKYNSIYLETQGLIVDETRGITTSGARREAPSMVFGISTPGPLDRTGPRADIGPENKRLKNTPVSRLGGSTFVLDDGDPKFFRATHASKGPPVYIDASEKEPPDAAIPHNECIRIRTRTGHQILLHNSEDLIYICNSRGTAWIELTSNGKIDIYAADSFNVHAGGDINLSAGGSVNIEGSSVNIKGDTTINGSLGTKGTITTESSMIAGGEITASGALAVGGSAIVGGDVITGGGNIAGGGGGVSVAGLISGVGRKPGKEPWAGHENLHGGGYTSIPDTFKKKKKGY